MITRTALASAVLLAGAASLAAQEQSRVQFKESIKALSYSPDGKTLAILSGSTATPGGTVYILDAASLKETQSWKGEYTSLRFVDGGTLALAAREIVLRNLSTKEEKIIGKDSHPRFLEVSPDGKTIAAWDNRAKLILYDVASGEEKMIFDYEKGSWITGAGFSRDGKKIAAIYRYNAVCLWEVESGNAISTYSGSNDMFKSLDFSADGKILYLAGTASIHRWDLAANKDDKICSDEVWIRAHYLPVRLSPDGTMFATGAIDLSLFNAAGKKLVELKGHHDEVLGLAFSPDGRSLVSGCAGGTLIQWSTALPKPPTLLQGHKQAVQIVAVSPDGKRIASSGDEGTIRIWDLAAGKEIAALEGCQGTVYSLAFSPDGKVLGSAGADMTPRLWDVESGKMMFALGKEGAKHKNELYSIAFSPDGKLVATGGKDISIMIWDAQTGERKSRWKLENRVTCSLLFTSDSARLIHGYQNPSSQSAYVSVWDVASGKEGEPFEVQGGWIYSMARTSDDKGLLVGTKNQKFRLWDLSTGNDLVEFRGRYYEIYGVAISPDGKRIANCNKGGTIDIWDMTGTRKAVLEGHKGQVFSVAFTPDGKKIVSGSEDRTVRIWELP